MKKISYFELAMVFLTIIISFNLGINIYILKMVMNTSSWISIIIGYIIGLIPLIIILYIANYRIELNLFEKNRLLFGKVLGNIINIFIDFIFLIIAVFILYDVVNFISTQFLYRTPIIISTILFLGLVIYGSIKEINVIMHVGFILMVINIILFIVGNISLISNIKIDNLLPILNISLNNVISSSLKIVIINILPILLILIIPKGNVTNPKKYNKAIIISYLIGFIISFITVINTIGVLGIYLTDLFEYSEYMVLKKIKLFGFLERVENIISINYISTIYIYVTFIVYSISKSVSKNSDKIFRCLNIFLGIILLLLIKILFNNITLYDYLINNYFCYIVGLLFLLYIIIFLRIIVLKRVKCKV